MATVTFTIKEKTVKDSTGYEGSFQLPNSTTSKLVRKDGSTLYPNRASVTQAARRLATVVGMDAEFAEPTKRAAKKSTTPKKVVTSNS